MRLELPRTLLAERRQRFRRERPRRPFRREAIETRGARRESGRRTTPEDGIFVTDVRQIRLGGPVAAIPEPGTYALMMAGLAAIGFIGRRRETRK